MRKHGIYHQPTRVHSYINLSTAFSPSPQDLIEDALSLVTRSLGADDVESFPASLSCQGTDTWGRGADVVERMRRVSGQFLYYLYVPVLVCTRM